MQFVEFQLIWITLSGGLLCMWSSGGKNQWANMKHESRTRSGVKMACDPSCSQFPRCFLVFQCCCCCFFHLLNGNSLKRRNVHVLVTNWIAPPANPVEYSSLDSLLPCWWICQYFVLFVFSFSSATTAIIQMKMIAWGTNINLQSFVYMVTWKQTI